MPITIADYFQTINDPHAPKEPKPELAQYDNHQIYDLVCVDVTTQRLKNALVVFTKIRKQNKFLAIQAYSVRPIKTNFIAIIKAYP
jgi:hypothetical protein